MVRDGPYQWGPQISSSTSWRVTTVPGSLGQAGQQVELGEGEEDLDAGHPHSPCAPVDLELADLLGAAGVGRRPGPPGDGADPGDEFSEPERLDQVVIGAQLEPDHPINLFTPGADHQNGDVGAAAKAPAHLEAVDVGKTEIQQHHVDPFGLERGGAGCTPG